MFEGSPDKLVEIVLRILTRSGDCGRQGKDPSLHRMRLLTSQFVLSNLYT